MKIQPLATCLAFAALITFAPRAQASVITFTSQNGPSGFLIQDGTTTHVGTFFFNIFDGAQASIGVDIIGSWPLSGEVTGFGLDFTGAFSSPRTIASATFTNENDLVDHTDDVTWSTTKTSITTTSTNTSSGDTIANGEWWDTQVRFTATTQGSLGFTGYFVVQDSVVRDSGAPEPSTWMLLATGLCSMVWARVKFRQRTDAARS